MNPFFQVVSTSRQVLAGEPEGGTRQHRDTNPRRENLVAQSLQVMIQDRQEQPQESSIICTSSATNSSRCPSNNCAMELSVKQENKFKFQDKVLCDNLNSENTNKYIDENDDLNESLQLNLVKEENNEAGNATDNSRKYDPESTSQLDKLSVTANEDFFPSDDSLKTPTNIHSTSTTTTTLYSNSTTTLSTPLFQSIVSSSSSSSCHNNNSNSLYHYHTSPITPPPPSPTPKIQGSTPLSQIGANPCPPPPETSIISLLGKFYFS